MPILIQVFIQSQTLPNSCFFSVPLKNQIIKYQKKRILIWFHNDLILVDSVVRIYIIIKKSYIYAL